MLKYFTCGAQFQMIRIEILTKKENFKYNTLFITASSLPQNLKRREFTQLHGFYTNVFKKIEG